MNSRRLHPPRPPKERVRPVEAATEMGCTAKKVSVFGSKPALHYFFFSSTLLCFFLSKKEDVLLFSPRRGGCIALVLRQHESLLEPCGDKHHHGIPRDKPDDKCQIR